MTGTCPYLSALAVRYMMKNQLDEQNTVIQLQAVEIKELKVKCEHLGRFDLGRPLGLDLAIVIMSFLLGFKDWTLTILIHMLLVLVMRNLAVRTALTMAVKEPELEWGCLTKQQKFMVQVLFVLGFSVIAVPLPLLIPINDPKEGALGNMAFFYGYNIFVILYYLPGHLALKPNPTCSSCCCCCCSSSSSSFFLSKRPWRSWGMPK